MTYSKVEKRLGELFTSEHYQEFNLYWSESVHLLPKSDQVRLTRKLLSVWKHKQTLPR